MNIFFKLTSFLSSTIIFGSSFAILTKQNDVLKKTKNKLSITTKNISFVENMNSSLNTYNSKPSALWSKKIYKDDFELPKNSKNFLIKQFNINFQLEYTKILDNKIFEKVDKNIEFAFDEEFYQDFSNHLFEKNYLKIKANITNIKNINFRINSFSEADYFLEINPMISKSEIKKISIAINYQYQVDDNL